VISCYEAGYAGVWLHRRLEAHGVRNMSSILAMIHNTITQANPSETLVSLLHRHRHL
jgi:hypothetical protein